MCSRRSAFPLIFHLNSRSSACAKQDLCFCSRPATTRRCALSARFAGDVSDIHAAVLTGFVAELAHVELGKPRIMLRLRWAAYRAGQRLVHQRCVGHFGNH